MSGLRRFARPAAARRERSLGQSLVEFSVIVPAFMLILFGMLEFGFVFTHNLTLEYATREGARAGSALADGNGVALTCDGDGTSANPGINAQIIAAVERVLESPGSPVAGNLTPTTTVKIWKASGSFPASSAATSTWIYGAASGPSVDGKPLDFHETAASASWTPCSRNNGASPDSIGVSITYTYNMVTPLSSVARFFGGGASTGTLSMADQTIMALNP